jgi:hypothetical protein
VLLAPQVVPLNVPPDPTLMAPVQVLFEGGDPRLQLPQAQDDEHVSVPLQLPTVHVRVVPGVHTPSPVQAPQAQVDEHTWVPQLPHACVEPGEQTPTPVQVPQVPHEQLDEHVRVWLPQLPQDWLCVSPRQQL